MAKLVALQGHKTLAVEARDALSDSRLVNAPLALREMIASCLQRAGVLIDLLDNGGKNATKVVESIDNLTWKRVKDWAPESFIRCKRDELSAVNSMPQIVESVSATLAQDLETIQRLMRMSHAEPGKGNPLDEDAFPPKRQSEAHTGRGSLGGNRT